MEQLTNRMGFFLLMAVLAFIFLSVSKYLDYRLKVKTLEEANYRHRLDLEAEGNLEPIIGTLKGVSIQEEEHGHA